MSGPHSPYRLDGRATHALPGQSGELGRSRRRHPRDFDEVKSPLHHATSEMLSNDTDYYLHVRLRNRCGWVPGVLRRGYHRHLPD